MVGMNKHLRLTRHDRPEHRHKYTVYLLTPKRRACLHSGTLMNILFKSSQKVIVHSLCTHGRIIIRNNAVYVVNSCILNTCTSPTPPKRVLTKVSLKNQFKKNTLYTNHTEPMCCGNGYASHGRSEHGTNGIEVIIRNLVEKSHTYTTAKLCVVFMRSGWLPPMIS